MHHNEDPAQPKTGRKKEEKLIPVWVMRAEKKVSGVMEMGM